MYPVDATIYELVKSCNMLYGWPAGYQSQLIPSLGLPYHQSSISQEVPVNKYLRKELDYQAILSPFPTKPFEWVRTNPMMVRPKKEEGKYRVILDLSFPLGESVNQLIPRFSFDGAPYKLQLPTALDLAEIIADCGKGCYIYKLDLSRAYRQLPFEPFDWPVRDFLAK